MKKKSEKFKKELIRGIFWGFAFFIASIILHILLAKSLAPEIIAKGLIQGTFFFALMFFTGLTAAREEEKFCKYLDEELKKAQEYKFYQDKT